MPTERDKVVFDISVSQKLISDEQAQRAFNRLRSYERAGKNMSLSVLLEQLGLINSIQRQSLENAAQYRISRDVDKVIGQLLDKHCYLERNLIDAALAAQKNHYRETGLTIRIGDWLVQNGMLNQDQVIAIEKLFDLRENQAQFPGF